MTSYKSDLPSALFYTAPSQQQKSPPHILKPPSFSFQISYKDSLTAALQPRQMLPQEVRPKCRAPGEGVEAGALGRQGEDGDQRIPVEGHEEPCDCTQGWKVDRGPHGGHLQGSGGWACSGLHLVSGMTLSASAVFLGTLDEEGVAVCCTPKVPPLSQACPMPPFILVPPLQVRKLRPMRLINGPSLPGQDGRLRQDLWHQCHLCHQTAAPGPVLSAAPRDGSSDSEFKVLKGAGGGAQGHSGLQRPVQNPGPYLPSTWVPCRAFCHMGDQFSGFLVPLRL